MASRQVFELPLDYNVGYSALGIWGYGEWDPILQHMGYKQLHQGDGMGVVEGTPQVQERVLHNERVEVLLILGM